MEKKKVLVGVLTVVAIAGWSAFGYHVWTVNNIPYSYRQSVLDVIDYVAGKNVFGRSNSLM